MKYGINTLFVQNDMEKELIGPAAKASGEWTTLYEDDYAVVMQRIGQ